MYSMQVTLGWDLCPTIELEDGSILSRKAERIIHGAYYPKGTRGEWPVDPYTGEKLPMADPFSKKRKQLTTPHQGKERAREHMVTLCCYFWCRYGAWCRAN